MPPPSMSRSARGVEALRIAALRVERIEDELKHAKAEVKRLEEVELPAAFTEDGISELRLPTGQRAARQVSVQGSCPDQNEDPEGHERALQLWREMGNESTVRAAVIASYALEDAAAARETYAALRGDNRAFVTLKQTVHASTWKAAILARIRAGEPTDVEALGCVVIRRVRLTTPPRRRSPTEDISNAGTE